MRETPHKPVLIDKILELCAPIRGVWLDGTFGAGGYTRALLAAGAKKVVATDRDPLAHDMAANWLADYEGQIELHCAQFSELADFAKSASLDGVVLDIGVSSMQIDEAERGFSFMKDGPLDMRMSQEGASAADLVNSLSESDLADVLYEYGEERASRRIARAVVLARKNAPLTRTSELAGICERALPRKKPHDPHPATRSFQALRIAVNRELDELKMALAASLSVLRPGGLLVVVSFHSLEDRIVKNFIAQESGKANSVNRFQPELKATPRRLEAVTRKPVIADDVETSVNPRARSAKLRIARRLEDAA